MMGTVLTAESVAEGHPDKIADQISDAVLDAILVQDPSARVACETYVKTGMVLVGGEISTHAWIDIEELTRQTLRRIGYAHPELGFEADSCAVLSAIGKQSPDIRRGVDKEGHQGAGDQGVMFGYATAETPELMPAPIIYAHRLMQRQAQLRKSGELPWLRPDAKSQLTFRYHAGQIVGVESCVLSTQHDEAISQSALQEAVMECIIKPVLPEAWLNASTRYFINPTGRFVIGGPQGDCGLTGRKLMVDTYGPSARHGGGAFSGKDPSKVDRSGAYAARYVAKNLVAAQLSTHCEVQLSYAIGVAEPVSVQVQSFGTGKLSDQALSRLITAYFDLTPTGIISTLDLLRPIYFQTASYGHFGREGFPWEATDQVEGLLAAAQRV